MNTQCLFKSRALLLFIFTYFITYTGNGVAQDSGLDLRASNARSHERIIGGESVMRGKGPWAVSIQRQGLFEDTDSWQHFCGGSFVSPRVRRDLDGNPYVAVWEAGIANPTWVITAAHCLFDKTGVLEKPSDFQVLSGTLDRLTPAKGDYQKVTEIHVHPKYRSKTLQNDIALLRLEASNKPLDKVARSSIRLPGIKDTHWITDDYLAVYAQGWGRTFDTDKSRYLQEALLPLVNTDACAERFYIHGVSIRPGMICAGFSSGSFDSCQGDSGGPLVYRSERLTSKSTEPVLVGAVSWGISCGRADLFGVYSSLAYFRSWIEEAVEISER